MTKLKKWLWISVPTISVVGAGLGLGIGLAAKINSKNNSLVIDVDYQSLSFWKSNEYSWYDCIKNRVLYRYFPDKNKIGKYQILPNGNLSLISFFRNYKVV